MTSKSDRMPFLRAGGDWPRLDSGSYPGVCVGVEPCMKKKYQSTETEPGIKFTWLVEDEDAGETHLLSRKVTPAVGPRANLCKDMTTLHGKEAFEAVSKNDDQLWDLIDKTVGMMAMLDVVKEEGDTGFYNYVKSVAKLPKALNAMQEGSHLAVSKYETEKQERLAKQEAKTKAAGGKIGNSAYDDDDIPF